MPTEIKYPHIVKPANGPARLEKHPRTRVAMIVADYLWRGWSAEEIARQYPYLTLAEIHAALTYYFDNREEIEAELLAEDKLCEESEKQHPPSPMWFRLKALKQRAGS